jgi:hypothetical protein
MYVCIGTGTGSAQDGGVRVDDAAAMDVVKQVVVVEPETPLPHSVKESEQMETSQEEQAQAPKQQQKSSEKDSSKGNMPSRSKERFLIRMATSDDVSKAPSLEFHQREHSEI